MIHKPRPVLISRSLAETASLVKVASTKGLKYPWKYSDDSKKDWAVERCEESEGVGQMPKHLETDRKALLTTRSY